MAPLAPAGSALHLPACPPSHRERSPTFIPPSHAPAFTGAGRQPGRVCRRGGHVCLAVRRGAARLPRARAQGACRAARAVGRGGACLWSTLLPSSGAPCCTHTCHPPAGAQVGAQVHEGLRLEFAHKGHPGGGGSQGEGEGGAGAGSGSEEEEGSTDESGGARGGWRPGLDALSGGQRTLVSLAFVAAVGGRAAWLGSRRSAAGPRASRAWPRQATGRAATGFESPHQRIPHAILHARPSHPTPPHPAPPPAGRHGGRRHRAAAAGRGGRGAGRGQPGAGGWRAGPGWAADGWWVGGRVHRVDAEGR